MAITLMAFSWIILCPIKCASTQVFCLLHQILLHKHWNSLWDYPSHTISSLLFISVSCRVEQWLKTALCSPCWTEIAYAAFDGWLNTKIISCILQGSCESVCFLFPDLPLNRRPTFAPWQQHFLPRVKELWESVENQGSYLEAQAKSSWHFHTKSLDVVPGLCTVIGWWVPESDWAEVFFFFFLIENLALLKLIYVSRSFGTSCCWSSLLHLFEYWIEIGLFFVVE